MMKVELFGEKETDYFTQLCKLDQNLSFGFHNGLFYT